MGTRLIILFVVFVNWRSISRWLTPPKPPAPAEKINTGEFVLLKPPGFVAVSGNSHLFAAEIYSEKKAGGVGAVDGEMVREEFNHAWAVVSVTPGDALQICEAAATENCEAVQLETD
ncbi:MAG: hypothetical protein HC873_10885 [Leptolyngbyaceae cyanobacterium SL_1_1]|nr:hypothetical protein [Leptolyngbyaceae cyanobacterium RM1_1_2]NJO10066.1 hypothetical protein [Leptolyngbyaceae cyanobacterium SL_1_1]